MIKTTPDGYRLIPSAQGTAALLWRFRDGQPLILRIILPREEQKLRDLPRFLRNNVREQGTPVIDDLCRRISRFLAGEDVRLGAEHLDWTVLPAFSRSVLEKTMAIPRGRVATYGSLAEKIGKPSASRAVGQALARNPFPLFIPCHRVVTASGILGGFSAGSSLKKTLLRLEGVPLRENIVDMIACRT